MNLFHIFTKEYREETKYLECMRKLKQRPELKLKPAAESETADAKVAVLKAVDLGK